MSDFLWPHGLQHARLLCPPLSPEVCSNSCPLSQRCYLTVSSSAVPFSSCPQSFAALGSFPVSWLFTSGGQSIELRFQHLSFHWIVRVNFPLGLSGLISLQSRGLSRIFSRTIWKHQFFSAQLSLWSNSHIRKNVRKKTYLWLYEPLLTKWCLCFLRHCPGFS